LSIGHEVTTRGSTFTIRKFKEIPITPIELIDYGTFSVEMMAYLWMAVENGFNILISGGTASGKTTVLNSIAMFIPPESKMVSIEDTREINLMHQNWIPAVTREAEEGGRSIEMFDLLKAALRQRPEYILVAKCVVEKHIHFSKRWQPDTSRCQRFTLILRMR
jgi:flagellar protein FlaI